MCDDEQIARVSSGIVGVLDGQKKERIMKIQIATSCFVIGALLSPYGAHAEDKDADHKPMTFIKDSVITTKIKAMLAEEKMKTLLHITVDTDSKGEVLLGGTAGSQEDIDKAVSIARKVEGVTSVRSEIKVKNDK